MSTNGNVIVWSTEKIRRMTDMLNAAEKAGEEEVVFEGLSIYVPYGRMLMDYVACEIGHQREEFFAKLRGA